MSASGPRRKVALCPNRRVVQGLHRPAVDAGPDVQGRQHPQDGEHQLAQLDVPAINRGHDKAAALDIGTERNEAWAEINKMITEQAPAFPFIWDKTAIVCSKDVQGVGNDYLTGIDFTFTSFK